MKSENVSVKYEMLVRQFSAAGGDLEELVAASRVVAHGLVSRNINEAIYQHYIRETPLAIWDWISEEDIDPKQKDRLVSRFQRDYVELLLEEKRHSELKELILGGAKLGEEVTLQGICAENAIAMLGQNGMFSEDLLAEILDGGRPELVDRAYGAWITSLPAEQVLEFSLADFPTENQSFVARSIISSTVGQPIDERVDWIEGNVSERETQKLLLEEAYGSEIRSDNLISVLDSIADQEVMTNISLRHHRMMSSNGWRDRVPNADQRINELEVWLEKHGIKP